MNQKGRFDPVQKYNDQFTIFRSKIKTLNKLIEVFNEAYQSHIYRVSVELILWPE